MRDVILLAVYCGATAACSVERVTFRGPDPPVEDCSVPGDEDGNGLADCADPACIGTDACRAPCTIGTDPACAALTCAELLAQRPATTSGAYWIALPGTVPAHVYCDMASGGWTLVMNQVPGADLPDDQATVGLASFGTLDHSYRLGGAEISDIRPAVAWKLTDNLNRVFFSPACTVDWSIDYFDKPASPCTVGYTTETRATPYNGGFVNVATRGIGINNNAQFCSIRAYNTLGPGGFEPGPAASCLYTRTEIVQLWFR